MRSLLPQCRDLSHKKPWHITKTFSRIIASFTLAAAVAVPTGAQQKPADLTNASLEDLMNVEVTSVSKKEQRLSHTASAIFVITSEDIRQSGATNIPDLLRMVPGLQVAQINSDTWAITARGFNGQYSSDLLVLVDGRTIYSPIFAGVYWDAQNIPLENIDRIEVIRGPGATVWGANAVNGVINIIRKKSEDTQGRLVTGGAGSYEHGFGTIRYGGKFGNNATFRANVLGFNRDHFPGLTGQNGQDDWHAFSGGFRADSKIGNNDALMFQGDAVTGAAGEFAGIPSIPAAQNVVLELRDRFSGWDVLSRWDHSVSPTSQTTLQVYFDRSSRGDTTYATGLDTFDVDFQHHFAWGKRQDFVWGLDYRVSSDEIDDTFRTTVTPRDQTLQLFGSFVQDEIAIRPDTLYLTIGTKVEHNTYTGFGWEPSIRGDWIVNERSSAWVAVSEALRTPSQVDRSIRLNYEALPGPAGTPMLVSLFGSPTFGNQQEKAVEVGYRTNVSNNLSIDATAFFNRYDHMLSVEPDAAYLEASPAPPHIVIPSHFGNLLYAETHGTEIFANWKPVSRWTLSPGYSYLSIHAHTHTGSLDTTTAHGAEGEAGSPNHQAELRSTVRPGHGLEFNASAYFVGRLPAQHVPSYTRLDTNLMWQRGEWFSIGVVGQNLLEDHHLEDNDPFSTQLSSLVKRSAYIKVSWQF